MSTSATDIVQSYTGNASTTVFTFPAKFLDNDHLKVYLDGVAQTSGFTVSGGGSASGGSVTFTSAPASGVEVVIVNEPPLTQLLDLTFNGKMPSTSLENAYDKLTMLCQLLDKRTDQSIKFPIYDTASLPTDLTLANRQGKLLGFDTSSNAQVELVSRAQATYQSGDRMVFASVSALTTEASITSVSSGDVVLLTGYYVAGDFGSPIELIVEASTGGVKSHTLNDGRYANLYTNTTINIGWFGAKTTNTASQNTTVINTIITDVGADVAILVPKGYSVDYDTISGDNTNTLIMDDESESVYINQLRFGNFGGGNPDIVTVRGGKDTDRASLYVMPNGRHTATDATAKIDIFADDYHADQSDYRTGGLYYRTGSGHNNIGSFFINAKNSGNFWGAWPDLGLSTQDETRVPLRAVRYLTGASAIYQIQDIWRTGISVTANDYYIYDNKVYQAQTTATTGATAPTHTSGTVSDGTVDWLFVENLLPLASTANSLIMIGDGTEAPPLGSWAQALRLLCNGDLGIGWGDSIRFVDSGQTEGNPKIYRNSNEIRISADDGTAYMRFASTFTQRVGMAKLLANVVFSDADTTPSVQGGEIFKTNNSGATTITQFDDMLINQEFRVYFTDTNTTIAHDGVNISLKGAVNVTGSGDQCITFYAITASKAIEISRNF